MHEPGTVVVHIHGPGLVIFAKHHVFHGVDPSNTKRGVRVVVVAINTDLPVVGTLVFEWKWCGKLFGDQAIGSTHREAKHQSANEVRCAFTLEKAAVPSTTRSS